MSAARRVGPAGLSAGLVLGSILVMAQTASAAEDDLSPIGKRAFAEVAGCASGADALLAAIVVDESLSLRSTDPGDARVDGVIAAVDALADLGAQSDELDVQVELSVFGRAYETLVDWGSLDIAHADRLRRAAVEDLPGRDAANATDYRQALRGAQQDLDAQASAIEGPSCKLLLWFTDGGLDVDEETSAARNQICASRGLADGLRGDGIAVIALALFTEDGGAAVTPAQREELRAVAEGQGSGVTCGTAPLRSDVSAGAYLRADDASSLQRLFAGAIALLGPRVPGPSVTCPGENCPGDTVGFPVDAGIAGVRVIADLGDDAAVVQVTGPDGATVGLASTSSPEPVAGGEATATTRTGLTTIDLVFDQTDGDQVGTWQVGAVTSGGAVAPVAVDVYYEWGATLQIEVPDGLLIGEPSEIQVILRGSSGDPIPPSTYADQEVELFAGDTSIELEQTGTGFRGNYVVPSADATSSVSLSATARATTRPSAIGLGPTSATLDLGTSFPASFPTFTPSQLDLPALIDDETVAGTLTFTGSDVGPTGACITGTDLVGPADAGALTLSSESQCIDIPANEVVTWEFTAATESPADGRVEGTMTLQLTGTFDSGTIDVAVPVGLTMTRPVNTPLRFWLAVLLIAASLALPLLMLALANAFSIGRYKLTPLTRAASVPVVLTPGGVTRKGGSRFEIEADDYDGVSGGRTFRTPSFVAHGASFGRRLPWWPLRSPRATATGSMGEIAASSVDPYTDGRGQTAPLDFGPSSWVFLADRSEISETEARGRLVFVDESTDFLQVITAREEGVRDFAGWSTLFDRVRAAATVEAEPTEPAAGKAWRRRDTAAEKTDGSARRRCPPRLTDHRPCLVTMSRTSGSRRAAFRRCSGRTAAVQPVRNPFSANPSARRARRPSTRDPRPKRTPRHHRAKTNRNPARPRSGTTDLAPSAPTPGRSHAATVHAHRSWRVGRQDTARGARGLAAPVGAGGVGCRLPARLAVRPHRRPDDG